MKFLFDYFPIICFFVAYKIWGIYVATAVAMVISALQVSGYWLRYRKVEKIHIITLALILLLGGTTLILHDAIFIKLKPSVIYWVFALMFFASHWFTSKTLIERLLGDKMQAPTKTWAVINYSWGIFFFLLGFLNLYVVYHFDTNTWVNFKLFGTLGLMLVFIVAQAFYLAKHTTSLEDNKEKDNAA